MVEVVFPDALMSAASPYEGERPMSFKLGLIAILLFVGFEPDVEAHDIYSPLKNNAGTNCCDEGDCRPAPYRLTPTGVQMFAEGEWIAVPHATIQYRTLPDDTGETDGGHWCGRFENGPGFRMGYAIYCAILPPNPTAISRASDDFSDALHGQEGCSCAGGVTASLLPRGER
jgi:hypothetical protein